jgi:hypothetical protein
VKELLTDKKLLTGKEGADFWGVYDYDSEDNWVFVLCGRTDAGIKNDIDVLLSWYENTISQTMKDSEPIGSFHCKSAAAKNDIGAANSTDPGTRA